MGVEVLLSGIADCGCVTLPLLGTKAKQEDKLAFEPDRTKRRAIYEDV